MKKKLRFSISIFSFVCLVCYIVIDYFYHERMFEDNRQFAVSFQKENNSIVKGIFIFASILGYPFGIGTILFIIFILCGNKVEVLAFMIFNFSSVFVSALLKLLYHDPRPFWVYSDIELGFICDKDFGNPSGHAFISALTFPILFYELYAGNFLSKKITNPSFRNDLESPTNEGNPLINLDTNEFFGDMGKIQKFNFFKGISIFSFSFLLVGVIAVSRIYLGSHSYNQILLGLVYGSFLCLYYYLFFKSLLIEFLTFICQKRVSFENTKRTIMIGLILIYIACILITISIFMYADSNFVLLPSYVSNINSKCNISITLEKGFQSKVFLNCVIMSGVIGVFFGIIFSYGNPNTDGFQEAYKESSWKNRILRILSLLLIEIVPGLLFLVGQFVPGMIYLQFFINSLAVLLGSFIAIYWYPQVLRKFNLDLKGEFLRQEKDTLII